MRCGKEREDAAGPYTRVARDGSIVGTPGFTIAAVPEGEFSSVSMPDVTFDGTRHQVVWLDSRPPTSPLNPQSIRGTHVTVEGTVPNPGGVPLLPEVFTDFPFTAPPAIAADDEGHSLLVHTRFIEDPDVHSFRLVGGVFAR